jgi:hypothetical protein
MSDGEREQSAAEIARLRGAVIAADALAADLRCELDDAGSCPVCGADTTTDADGADVTYHARSCALMRYERARGGPCSA